MNRGTSVVGLPSADEIQIDVGSVYASGCVCLMNPIEAIPDDPAE